MGSWQGNQLIPAFLGFSSWRSSIQRSYLALALAPAFGIRRFPNRSAGLHGLHRALREGRWQAGTDASWFFRSAAGVLGGEGVFGETLTESVQTFVGCFPFGALHIHAV